MPCKPPGPCCTKGSCCSCFCCWTVNCYDCLRAWFNPSSISYAPWSKKRLDCHEVYYDIFSAVPEDQRITQLKALKQELAVFIDKINCGPIMIRLAWHDSGTYDQRISSFPERGGANGAIIHTPELNMGANNGLAKAVNYLKPLKDKYPLVSVADLIQLASATAVEVMGGPTIDMKYGRLDVEGPQDCAKPTSREGFAGNAGLPDAKPPFGCGAQDPATHLRNVFTKKMGFTDQEIVALSGAHTVGRAFIERSGTCPFGYTDEKATTYTKSTYAGARKDGKPGVGLAGGGSWTTNWLTFDNTYFKPNLKGDPHLLWFPTDDALRRDKDFAQYFDLYASDKDAFFKDYAAAHKKLSELGAKFEPWQGITL